MLHRDRDRNLRIRLILLCALWLAVFAFSISSAVFLDDHFDRISRARQIARYGELPFSDFLDPGYFMTEFSSAGMQLLLGDNLLGDVLVGSAFVATGAALVAGLTWHVSRSVMAAVLATLVAVLALPRGYDFDKVLFYPLAVALCWRYADGPSTKRIWALATGAVTAGLFRYDTGAYALGAGVVTLVVLHAGEWAVLRRRLIVLAAAIGCLSLPALVYLQWTAGLVDVADQVASYARREMRGTRIATPPAISLTSPLSVKPLASPSQAVIIRWQPSVDDDTRREAEARHTLVDGTPRGEPSDRTWRYRIEDSSATSLRALLQDPLVEDSSGIDQNRLTLTPEPWWTRAQRAVPLLRLRLFAGAWHSDNADALLYYLFRWLPFAAALALVLMVRTAVPISRTEMAKVVSLIALCVAVNVFILRHPLAARTGGMIGPAVILAVWLAYHAWHIRHTTARWLLRATTVVALAVAVWSVSVSASWTQRLTPDLIEPARFARFVGTLAASPPEPDLLESRGFTALVHYLRECTAPNDRLLATFFAPEIYFFAQRGFAAGLAALSGGHWSERRFQERSLQYLKSNPAAMIIHRPADLNFFQTYSQLSSYLAEHYRNVGTTDFLGGQSEERFTLFVPNDRAAASTHGSSSMPCFR